MPSGAVLVAVPRLSVDRLVGDQPDPGDIGVRVVREVFDRAEASGERQQLFLIYFLSADQEKRMVEPSPMDGGERVIGERAAQIDPGYFGAERIGEPPDLRLRHRAGPQAFFSSISAYTAAAS